MVNLENANVAIRFLYLISLIGLAVFLSLFFWYSNRRPEELSRRNGILIGLVICFFAFCITIAWKVTGENSATPSMVVKARTILWGLLDVLAGVLYFRITRLYEEEPQQKKLGSTQRLGFAMMLLSVDLALKNL